MTNRILAATCLFCLLPAAGHAQDETQIILREMNDGDHAAAQEPIDRRSGSASGPHDSQTGKRNYYDAAGGTAPSNAGDNAFGNSAGAAFPSDGGQAFPER